MRFSSREDIDQPIGTVFAAVTNFDGFERAALRRGAEVTRKGPRAAIGQSWNVVFTHRGRERVLDARLDKFDPPRGLTLSGAIGGLRGTLVIDLVALSPDTTRLSVEVDMKPTGISSRIFIQSLRLVKASLNNRFRARIRHFASQIGAADRAGR